MLTSRWCPQHQLVWLIVTKGSLTAYIDESGQRARSDKSSPHFIMSAVVVRDAKRQDAEQFLTDLKTTLGRKPDQVLHWKNYNSHGHRLLASSNLGARPDLFKLSSVVVCKRHLADNAGFNEDLAYLYTFRYLLERLSWLARSYDTELSYVLGHVVRFKIAKLREYEAKLQGMNTEIKWRHLSKKGGRIDQPSREPLLQIADIAASAAGAAFNPDQHGFTEQRYLQHLIPATYRPESGAITTYGLKMHPWNGSTKAAYPWVAAL